MPRLFAYLEQGLQTSHTVSVVVSRARGTIYHTCTEAMQSKYWRDQSSPWESIGD